MKYFAAGLILIILGGCGGYPTYSDPNNPNYHAYDLNERAIRHRVYRNSDRYLYRNTHHNAYNNHGFYHRSSNYGSYGRGYRSGYSRGYRGYRGFRGFRGY